MTPDAFFLPRVCVCSTDSPARLLKTKELVQISVSKPSAFTGSSRGPGGSRYSHRPNMREESQNCFSAFHLKENLVVFE